MMKYQYLILIILSVTLQSCNRKGCSNPLADNYDPKVNKARDKDCTFGAATVSPCGNQIEFCANYDSLSLSGQMSSEEFSQSLVLTWENSGADFRKLDLEIFGIKEGNFSASNSGNKNTFTATYIDNNGVLNQTTGSLKITKYNSNDGVSGIFSVKFNDGSEIKEGHLYRVQ
ncbi:MAG: hypothetical protein KJ941_02020 [Bacteroidetes bacterium]|nr:hypothetical protein [Bacteroidota bacterium]